jgi:ABC-type transport system substrate-binding protein
MGEGDTTAMDYWQKTLNERTSRRRALGIGAGTALGAAFLAACGGGDSEGPQEEASGLLAKREDMTSQAKVGGVLKMNNPADPPHFDPHLLTLPAAAPTSLIFNKLLRIKPGVLQTSDGSMEPDMAESWEFSPDKLTLTMKIRQDVGTPPNQAPLNGRKLDASDVLFSWNRWAATGTNRTDLVNAVNPAAPVLSMEAPDARTIVIKLKEPVASILAGFASQLQGQYFVMPKEAEGGFDVRRNPIGAGAYYLSEYVPSSRLVYTRNPNSYDKLSYPAQIETPIITENAQNIAQLVAGNMYIHYAGGGISPDSVLQIKKDAPDIGLYQWDIGNVGATVIFGQKTPGVSPFRDARARQAWSMAMDRDLYLDTFANVATFRAEGLPVETGWNTATSPSDYKGWWIDPQSKEFGENGKFYNHDIAEAKKLMAAAGLASGITVNSNQIGGTDYGPLHARQIEVLEGMASEIGFKFEKKIYGYTTDWNPSIRDSRGFFEGIAYRQTPIPPEPGDALYAQYNKAGSFYYGYDPEGRGVSSATGPFAGDPTCEDLTAKIRSEFDADKRRAYGVELTKYLGKQQYFVRALASASGFNVAWPAVRNVGVFRGLSWGFLWKQYWIDETQAPLKKV